MPHIKLACGHRLNRVPGSQQLFTITSTTTLLNGWRAVYIGSNAPSGLTRWNLSRYRRLIPESQIQLRSHGRTEVFGFDREVKIGGASPTIFWGKQGMETLLNLSDFLNRPAIASELPKLRSVLYFYRPTANQSLLHVYLNGTFTISLPDTDLHRVYLEAVQAKCLEWKPELTLRSLRNIGSTAAAIAG